MEGEEEEEGEGGEGGGGEESWLVLNITNDMYLIYLPLPFPFLLLFIYYYILKVELTNAQINILRMSLEKHNNATYLWNVGMQF